MVGRAAIQVKNLGKQYRVGGQRQRYRTLRESIQEAAVAPYRRLHSILHGGAAHIAQERFWALKNLSFEIASGEVVGVIGPNGAGKSTLLKILARITEPTEGSVEIRGPIGSLLEVGTGFHPELTGRENIYLSGSILGMKKIQIERRFDEITAFSGVEKFLDTPVKHYSSGMSVRLAFSVAAHLEPAVLLVDEVLAVGDAAFQRKCLNKMREIASSGCTVLVVSHNMEAVVNLCSRAIWINSGRCQMDGTVTQVVQAYMGSSIEHSKMVPLSERKDRIGTGVIRFVDFGLEDTGGNAVPAVRTGDAIRLVASYVTRKTARDVRLWFDIRDHLEGRKLLRLHSAAVGAVIGELPPEGQVVFEIPHFPLMPGRYSVDLEARVNYKDRGDIVQNAATIDVLPSEKVSAYFSLPETGEILCTHSWSLR